MFYLLLNFVTKKLTYLETKMKPYFYLFFPLIFLFTQCGIILNKKPKEEIVTTQENVKTPEELLAEEKAKQDSIENAEFELMQKTAFGDLIFGMSKEETEQKNERRQQLGKYSYNFNYNFNSNNQLFKVRLNSDEVKAIQFDTELKNRYQNLFQIVSSKYGGPSLNRNFPSIFDVQKSKKYKMSQWEKGTKQIQLFLQEKDLNSYLATCEILDKNMNEEEIQRLNNLKNNDVIEAANKF